MAERRPQLWAWESGGDSGAVDGQPGWDPQEVGKTAVLSTAYRENLLAFACSPRCRAAAAPRALLTLAKAVYDKLPGEFDHRAFVSVGQSPDLKKVLMEILRQLDRDSYMSATMLDVGQLIGELRMRRCFRTRGTTRYHPNIHGMRGCLVEIHLKGL
jgi:hypothetical protein